ncbi:DUF2381 family protein [Cystobacter fuscus]|uniref:DUF2381 family protein n=1 Tax=Cystobacter fuscus TaxID=43 RepID=UPI0037BFD0D4
MGASAPFQTCPPPEDVEGRCIEVRAGQPTEMHEVQLSPGLMTTFVFDSDVHPEGMILEDSGRFEVAELGKRTLALMPTDSPRSEQPGALKVCFADSAAPACVSFRLLMHPVMAERQVRLLRHPRSADSLEAELRESHEENARLHAELTRLNAGRDSPLGLAGMLVSGVVDERGMSCSPSDIVQPLGAMLSAVELSTCRTATRVNVRVRVRNNSETPWIAQGAKLVGPKGEAWRGSVWPEEPVPPSKSVDLFIEARVEDVRMEGPFVLKLWEANGSRTVRLGRVAFPVLGAGTAF